MTARRNPSGALDLTAARAIDNVTRDEKRNPVIVRFETDIPPSVNHAYITTRKGQRILTPTGKAWKEYAGLIAKAAARKQGWQYRTSGILVMGLWAYWPDNRRRDIHNLHKLIADAFEGVLYKDDRWLLIRDEGIAIDRQRPRVEIEVREFEKI